MKRKEYDTILGRKKVSMGEIISCLQYYLDNIAPVVVSSNNVFSNNIKILIPTDKKNKTLAKESFKKIKRIRRLGL